MSYFDKETYATEDALAIGRIHCQREGWNDALVSFMQSGGFSPSTKLASITCPSLVLWGRQDGILEGDEFVPKFMKVLSDAELRWIEECGHVPHLEQPKETAEAMKSFLMDRVVAEQDADNAKDNESNNWFGAGIGLAGVGVSVAAVAGQF